jgi:aryl-alcohol dehydrogenase-like predicted oxidoreductase
MFNKYFSKVVIGTWSLSGDLGFVSKKNVISTIEACVENNFLEFDTAPTYGKGFVYKILKDVLKNVNGVKINTKCGYNSHFVKTFKIQDVIDSIDNSLHVFKKINTLFLHNPRNEIKEWSKLFNILNAYKKKNFINSIGISFARDCYFEKKIMNQFDYFQDEINLMRPQSIDFLSSFKAKLMARSPLASGCLSGNLNINSKFSKNDYRSSWLNDKARLKNILFQIDQLKKIFPRNLRAMSKFFLLQNKNISKVIFGIKNPSHIKELKKDINSIQSINKSQIMKLHHLFESNFKLPKNTYGY